MPHQTIEEFKSLFYHKDYFSAILIEISTIF